MAYGGVWVLLAVCCDTLLFGGTGLVGSGVAVGGVAVGGVAVSGVAVGGIPTGGVPWEAPGAFDGLGRESVAIRRCLVRGCC